MTDMETLRWAWVLLVTRGQDVVFPPEMYSSEEVGSVGGSRWSQSLASLVDAPTLRPFAKRWEVGDLSVRLVPLEGEPFSDDEPAWVGTFWTRFGYPDPEALALRGRDEAREWVRAPLGGVEAPVRVGSSDYLEWAVFGHEAREATAVAIPAKFVTSLVSEKG